MDNKNTTTTHTEPLAIRYCPRCRRETPHKKGEHPVRGATLAEYTCTVCSRHNDTIQGFAADLM